MDDHPLSRIVADVLGGKVDQYEIIMRKYQRSIFQYCYHMLGNYAEAEDCSQEVFLKAYRSLKAYKQDMPFEAWLYTIASNQCIDVLRKRKLSRYLPFLYQKDQDNTPIDQHIDAKYYHHSIVQAMSKLSPEERSLLILRCVEEKSYKEISLIMQKNSASLRKKYERCAVKFRKYYTQVKGEKKSHEDTQRSGTEKHHPAGFPARARLHPSGHEQAPDRA